MLRVRTARASLVCAGFLALLLAASAGALAASPFAGRWAFDRGPAADFQVQGTRLSAEWPGGPGAKILLDAEVDASGRVASGVYRMVKTPSGATLERWKVTLRLSADGATITMDGVRVPPAQGQFQYVLRRLGASRLTPEQKLEALLARFQARIPRGLLDNGPANNVRSLFDAKYDAYTCGGYQRQVLALLDGLKFSRDPADRELLDDWDYGPIQIFLGGHQAVVLYPKGTDWTRTGIVLDPWPTQAPVSYTMTEWSGLMGLGAVGAPGSRPAPSTAHSVAPCYPLLGGQYTDPALRSLTAEEKAFKNRLPPAEASRLDGLSVPEQRARIQALREPVAGRATTHCPLNPYLLDEAGRVTGFRGGRFRGDIPGVVAERLRLADGTWWTELSWRKSAEGATLVLEPAGTGPAVITVWLPGKASRYSLRVQPGAEGRLAVGQPGAPLTMAGRDVPAAPFTLADAAVLAGRPGSPDRLGSVWTVQEIGRWTGTWTRRPGTRTFDATWTSVDGDIVRDVLVVESFEGDRIVLYRQGNKGRYTGTLSRDGRRAEGTTDWYAPGWKWTATLRP